MGAPSGALPYMSRAGSLVLTAHASQMKSPSSGGEPRTGWRATQLARLTGK
jgi:hypothetical protein